MATTVTMHVGDVRDVMARLPDRCADLLVTSPPFLALRSYLPADHPDKHREIGSEPTPAAFLDTLYGLTADWGRLLPEWGSVCVELGDTMAGSGGAGGDYGEGGLREGQPEWISQRARIAASASANGSGSGAATRAPSGSPRNASESRAGVDAKNRGNTSRGTLAGPSHGWPLAKSMCLIPHAYTIGLAYGHNPLTGTPSPAGQWRVRNVIAWCLDTDTVVYARTPTGDRPMRLLHLHQQWQPDRFQLWDGERWTPVLGTSSSTADDAIEIEFRNGERIACTREHQWPIERGLLSKVVRADELTVGDVVPVVGLPDVERPEPPGLPDADIGWLCGVFLGDGSFDTKGRIQIAGHRVNDAARTERLARIAADYDGTCSAYEHGGGNEGNVVIRCRPLAEAIRRYIGGDNARNKHLTPYAWNRRNGFLLSLVEGYLVSDGHWEAQNERWRLGFTDNPWLARDLRVIGARLGADVRLRRIRRHVNPNHPIGGSPFVWRGEVRFARRHVTRAKHPGEIVAIRATRRRTFIDVGVEGEPHLFALGSGLLTHNCRPNPPVGSLGSRNPHARTGDQKFRPATSYITIACRGSGRYFDLDVVRSGEQTKAGGTTTIGDRGSHDHEARKYVINTGSHPAGAPPLDWHTDDLDGDWLWRLPTAPYKGSHYATFPVTLPRRLILAMAPQRVCRECGWPSERIVGTTEYVPSASYRGGLAQVDTGRVNGDDSRINSWVGPNGEGKASLVAQSPTLGWTDCGHDDWRPGRVLDPFGGSGTTAVAAALERRDAILIDLDARNVDLVRRRLHETVRILDEHTDGDTVTWTVEAVSDHQLANHHAGQMEMTL